MALYMGNKISRAQVAKEYKSVDDKRNNNLNQRARKERSQRFQHYIREQMMHEYGLDLNEAT